MKNLIMAVQSKGPHTIPVHVLDTPLPMQTAITELLKKRIADKWKKLPAVSQDGFPLWPDFISLKGAINSQWQRNEFAWCWELPLIGNH